MSSKGNPNIVYGDVELSEEDFAPENVRRRISIMIPEDVLATLRAQAAKEAIGYQTLINQILRKATDGDTDSLWRKKMEKKFDELAHIMASINHALGEESQPKRAAKRRK